MDTPETLAELRDKPKQRTDWIHVADLVNGVGRNKIIGRQKLSVEQVQEDGGLKGDTTSFPAWAVGTGVEAVLWGSREVSAALIAAIDEQMHTIGKCSAPETKCIDDNVLAEVEQEWQNSVDSENIFVNSLAEEWRMLLVFYVPDVVFNCVEGKHVMEALNALEGILARRLW